MLPYDYQEVVNLLHKLKVNALQLADSTDCAEKSIQLASCPEDVTSTLSWFPGKAAGKLGIILSLLDQIDIRHAYPFSRCDDMTEEKPAEDVRVILTKDGQVIYHFPHLPGKSFKPNRVKREYDKRNAIESAVMDESERCGRPVPVFGRYRMSFYHIYPTSQCTYFLKDNDNYEYKRCIDAITDSLTVTDDALRCQLTMATYLSDEIEPGTYCVVSDVTCPMLDEEDLSRLGYEGKKKAVAK